MPLFGKSQKSPQELVKALKEAVNSLERGDKKAEKAQEDVSKNLYLPLINRTGLRPSERFIMALAFPPMTHSGSTGPPSRLAPMGFSGATCGGEQEVRAAKQDQ
uniref:Uncharacterized protein n=1 Tax=Anopheles melas TaxID=34690 RepID=A0A182UFI4_9DIPT